MDKQFWPCSGYVTFAIHLGLCLFLAQFGSRSSLAEVLESKGEGLFSVENADVDLSYDGFEIFIPPNNLEIPEIEKCEQIPELLQQYKSEELKLRQSISYYTEQIIKVFSGWNESLSKNVDRELYWPEGTFLPVLALIENLNTGTEIVNGIFKKNGENLNDYFVEMIIFAEENCPYPQELIVEMDNYSGAVATTVGYYTVYLNGLTKQLEDLYYNFWRSLEGQSGKVPSQQTQELELMSGDEPGLSGLGEVSEIFENTFLHVYALELERLESEIEKASRSADPAPVVP